MHEESLDRLTQLVRLNITMAGERTTAGRSLRRIGREVAAIHAELMVLTLLLRQIRPEVCMIKHLAIEMPVVRPREAPSFSIFSQVSNSSCQVRMPCALIRASWPLRPRHTQMM